MTGCSRCGFVIRGEGSKPYLCGRSDCATADRLSAQAHVSRVVAELVAEGFGEVARTEYDDAVYELPGADWTWQVEIVSRHANAVNLNALDHERRTVFTADFRNVPSPIVICAIHFALRSSPV